MMKACLVAVRGTAETEAGGVDFGTSPHYLSNNKMIENSRKCGMMDLYLSSAVELSDS